MRTRPATRPIRHTSPARPAALLVALLLLGGCEELLPAYERPEILLEATIAIEPVRDLTELLGGGMGHFGVDLWNVSDDSGVRQMVLRVPYEVRVNVDVWLAADPARKTMVGTRVLFTKPEDELGPGRGIRVELLLPATDEEGRPWNWGRTDRAEHELVLQGRVRLRDLGLRMNTAPKRVVLIYKVP